MGKPAVPMSKIWKIRKDIKDGRSVREVAEHHKVSESTVRSYTKSERKIAQ